MRLRPSRDQVDGEQLERRALHQRHCARVDAQVRQSGDNAAEASSE
jgi:hypothetical protein